MPSAFDRWIVRHQHPASRVLHAIGIPMTVVAVGMFIIYGFDLLPAQWWLATAVFILSFALQWVGHQIEGNDMGEIILIKKALGLPYVAVSPRYHKAEDKDQSSTAQDRPIRSDASSLHASTAR